MADIAAVRITNIVSVTQTVGATANVIKGVRSIDIATNKGALAAILDEGNLYPTGAENLGTADFPVTTRANFESDEASALTALALASGTLAVVYKPSGGGGNKTITIVNHEFRSKSTPLALGTIAGRFPSYSIDGAAFSADGTTLPISVA